MRVLFVFLISILFFSCHPQNTVKNDSNCTTAISGKMLSGHRWFYNQAGIFKSKSSSKPILGSIVKIEKDGILFDPKDEVQIKFPPKFYSFNDLECVINEYGEIINGELPDSYFLVQSVELKFQCTTDSKEVNNFNLKIKANEPFYYCVNPGSYELVDMKISAIENNKYTPLILPKMNFTVNKNENNILGELSFDLSNINDSKTRILPYKRGMSFLKLPKNVHISFNPQGEISLGYLFINNGTSTEAEKDEQFDLNGIHVMQISKPEKAEIFNPENLSVNDIIVTILPNESEDAIKEYVKEKGMYSYK